MPLYCKLGTKHTGDCTALRQKSDVLQMHFEKSCVCCIERASVCLCYIYCSAGVQSGVPRCCVLHLDGINSTASVGLPAVLHSHRLVKTNNDTSDEEMGHTTYRCFGTGNTNKLMPV